MKAQNELKDVLSGCKVLSHRITLYIPSTIGEEHIDNTGKVRQALIFLSDMFQGATSEQVKGAWMEKGQLILENTVKVYANMSDINKEKMIKVVQYMKLLKKTMKQYAVAFEVDGTMYIY